jgi:16S rRNA (adenine1518-N6/adenine1519-N6)-dimethyltransferase
VASGYDKGIKAKKHLGQHFLKDQNVARQIANLLSYRDYDHTLEIGPGTGVLTQFLADKTNLSVVEMDAESVVYLKTKFPEDHPQVKSSFEVHALDFLQADLQHLMSGRPFAIVGNFPYNISSQIVFKLLEYRDLIPEFAGMFQKEVAQRICTPHGSKTYGILSVLTQAYYVAEYSFTVPPDVFSPPPKVDSGVLRLVRRPKDDDLLPSCDYKHLKLIVKAAFNQRRKTLRNSLKNLNLPETAIKTKLEPLRPEQVPVKDFIRLADHSFRPN